CLVDLLDLEGDELLLLPQLGLPPHQRVALPEELGHLLVPLPVRPDEAAEAAEVVEQLDVGLGAEERLVLVLPVEVYRVGGHLAEDVERGGGVVDEGAAARGRDLAADDEDAVRA